MYLKPSTWQALGLSVGAGYTVLGCFATFFPTTAARTYFNLGNAEALWPFKNAGGQTPYTVNKAFTADTDEGFGLLTRLMGARDLSIAIAIFALDWQGQYKSVGTVILGGMVLCAADVWAVWKQRGAGM